MIDLFQAIERNVVCSHISNLHGAALVSLGSHLFKEATSKLSPPGCSEHRTKTNKIYGSVEKRETVKFFTVTTTSPSDKVPTEPSWVQSHKKEIKK